MVGRKIASEWEWGGDEPASIGACRGGAEEARRGGRGVAVARTDGVKSASGQDGSDSGEARGESGRQRRVILIFACFEGHCY